MFMNHYCLRKSRMLTAGFACLIAFAISTSQAWATVQFSNQATLTPLITFDEVPFSTVNPIYIVGDQTVHFGSIFEGQTLGPTANSLSDSSPSNPLQLDASGPDVATLLDMSNPTLAVLGGAGEPAFSTPIAMLFSDPVNRLEFKFGSLDEAGIARIEAYDQQGSSLGLFQNTGGGLEQIALFDDASRNVIAGVSLFVEPDAMDWEGFAIDDVAFDFADDNVIPEPGALTIWSILALLGTSVMRAKRSR